MQDTEKILDIIDGQIKLLGQINVAEMEKTKVHLTSARLMSLSEKLNKLAYMMLYTTGGTDAPDTENMGKIV